MDNKKLQQFIYSCQRASLCFHFNNRDGIIEFMERLEDKPYLAVLCQQKNLLTRFGSGVCLTMSSWVFDLLYSMDADNYYLMESRNSYWSNFVILFEVNGEYRICDFAAEVRKNEELIDDLFDAEEDEVLKIHKELKTPCNLNMTIEEYTERYPIAYCNVIQHKGHENDLYYDVPRIKLKDFLENVKEKKTPQV